MRFQLPIRKALFFFLCILRLCAAGQGFVPGDQVFDADSGSFVDWNPARGGEYCEKCAALHPEGRHVTQEAAAEEEAEKKAEEEKEEEESAREHRDGKPDPVSNLAWWEAFLQYMESHSFLWWVVPAGVLLLVFAVSLMRGQRKFKVEEFPMVDGVPQGIALVPGQLVCAFSGAGDGGTAIGYRARLNVGGKWRHAFVKRMVGRSLRPDLRVPALRFEADILRKLADTEVVPEVFQMPAETVVGGENWNYFAMGEARGIPWPERGGLGKDTKTALLKLCEALVRIHGHKVGHYDLKPQNVFWDPRNKRITLIDFGSAIDHSGEFVNPLSGLQAGTKPWTPPEKDGKILADLTPAADAWVFGLMLCEALVGGVHEVDRTMRRSPERPDDRQWFKERLSETCSSGFAETVVEGLFSLQRTTRLTLDEFLTKMREEWE